MTDYPITWIARLINTDTGPQLTVMRDDPADDTTDPQWYEAPTAGDGFQLVDPRHNQRIAFLQSAQLRPEVDRNRPILQLTAVATSAFAQPDWPFMFGSYTDDDPMAGLWVMLNTPADVKLGWVEASLLRPGSLTVDDVIGGSR